MNIYQTGEFSSRAFGGQNLEEFVVLRGNKIVSAALVRIKTVLSWEQFWMMAEVPFADTGGGVAE